MTTPRHFVSVAAVITDDQDRVLVVQRRDNGKWEIPGCILELDESIHDGLRREVEEETGVLIEPERLTGVYKNMKLGVVALVFRAQIVSGQPRPTEESQRIDWWTRDDVVTQMARHSLFAFLTLSTPIGRRSACMTVFGCSKGRMRRDSDGLACHSKNA